MNNVIIYEDVDCNLLEPFCLNHATFEIRIGAYKNIDRIIKFFENDASNTNFILAVRDEIKELIKLRYPEFEVISNNDKEKYEGVFINGAVISETDKIKYLWDTFSLMKKYIESDFINFFSKDRVDNLDLYSNVTAIRKDKIYLGNNIILNPGVVLDASNGPIIISNNVKVHSNSVLEGPLYIGESSEISPLALIRGNTSIGPFCKIGGEVACSIFHGYSNKVHHGFIGHSYIGEWVNIGAGTNNSNLKNNYGEIKILFNNKVINTKLQFMGVLIGDYSRIAIGTNLNTGTNVSLGSNIFNYKLDQRYIKPFSWGADKKVSFDKFIETIEKMKARRDKNISNIEKDYLRFLYQKLKSN